MKQGIEPAALAGLPMCYAVRDGTPITRPVPKVGDSLQGTIEASDGEDQTLWHVVDRNAPSDEQPAVIRTFSSRNSTRDDVRRFLEGLTRSSS